MLETLRHTHDIRIHNQVKLIKYFNFYYDVYFAYHGTPRTTLTKLEQLEILRSAFGARESLFQ